MTCWFRKASWAVSHSHIFFDLKRPLDMPYVEPAVTEPLPGSFICCAPVCLFVLISFLFPRKNG